MSTTVVRTQAELDAALAALGDDCGVIEVRSPRGVWLRLADSRNARVEARESASVEAWGSASVVARESASVVARESASVEARGSASVVARESASVEAWESASVEAWESASVEATPHVAVHLHSARANVQGGVLIDVTQVDATAANWIEHHGIEVRDGQALVYKAVDDRWTTPRGFDYSPGAHVEAPDWDAEPDCGGGLHFGPTPRHARDYHPVATRYVKVAIPIADAVPIHGGTAKIKARSCLVLGEVDLSGKPVAEAVTA